MTLVTIKTQFASQEVCFSRGYKFTLDGNSKVTAGNGSFEAPAVNSFSLRHVLDCPPSHRDLQKHVLRPWSQATQAGAVGCLRAQCHGVATDVEHRGTG